jgi:predicted aspartyl protease
VTWLKEANMGRTFVEVEVENYDDIVLRDAATGPGRTVRKEKLRALVDTGCALLCLHTSAIRNLGLTLARSAEVRTANGPVVRAIYRVAQITILGRQYIAEVMEIPDDMPNLVGYIPLENLDLVVDPKTNQVIPNPESGGKYTLDLL